MRCVRLAKNFGRSDLHVKRASMRLLVLAAVVFSACAPQGPVAIEQIPTLETLKDVMHVQAKAADVHFKAIGTPRTDADWPTLLDAAKRLEATGVRTKAFTQGPGFDKIADELSAHAAELTKAAETKDNAAADTALTAIKGACKSCHKEYK